MDKLYFSDWLLMELNERGWSQSDLARKANINRQVVSSYINNPNKNHDPEILKMIARAFEYPPDYVFRAAGKLPPISEIDNNISEIVYLLDQLPIQEQKEILDLIRFKVERNKNKSSPGRAPAPKPKRDKAGENSALLIKSES